MSTIHKKMTSISFILILCLSLFSGCASTKPTEPQSKTNFFLGTVVTITIYDHASEEIFNQVFERIRDIENKMSMNIAQSEVMQINDQAGHHFVSVSKDTFDVIQKGIYYSELSQGKFDISIGPIVKLWNIGSEDARIPSSEEIAAKLKLVNYKDILLNETEQKVMLKDQDMMIDLGGIAKGFVADEVRTILQNNGVEHAIINLGGNIFALGNKPNGQPWAVGIQNPFEPTGTPLGAVKVANQSVVTSGIYERLLEKDGKKYHHILSTETGYPIENNLVGVSIITDQSTDGDGLSTTIFSLGLTEGMQLVEKLDGVDALFITKDSEIYPTSGIKNNFHLSNDAFTLKK
ncbi:FAD:protein FMN transferase [Clostridiaceae bacterium 35-E11]